jgi:hypothetical protein
MATLLPSVQRLNPLHRIDTRHTRLTYFLAYTLQKTLPGYALFILHIRIRRHHRRLRHPILHLTNAQLILNRLPGVRGSARIRGIWSTVS